MGRQLAQQPAVARAAHLQCERTGEKRPHCTPLSGVMGTEDSERIVQPSREPAPRACVGPVQRRRSPCGSKFCPPQTFNRRNQSPYGNDQRFRRTRTLAHHIICRLFQSKCGRQILLAWLKRRATGLTVTAQERIGCTPVILSQQNLRPFTGGRRFHCQFQVCGNLDRIIKRAQDSGNIPHRTGFSAARRNRLQRFTLEVDENHIA